METFNKAVSVALVIIILTAALSACSPDGKDEEEEVYGMNAAEFDNTGSAAVIRTVYPTDDFVIIELNAANPPYNADPTGQTDSTRAIQRAIEDLSAAGGGTVWLPSGRYRITGNIIIRPMVTLRGDWRDPDSGADPGDAGRYGTVIVVDMPSSENLTGGAFTMGGSSGAMGLTVYYPGQTIDDPKPYPFAFDIPGRALEGEHNYMLATLQNITLLNAYNGICAGLTPNGYGWAATPGQIHESHSVFNIKGTVLNRGLDMRNGADFGVMRDVDINPRYWLEAGEEYNAPDKSALIAYTRAHTTAFTLADIEWGNLSGFSCSDVDTGMLFVQGDRTRTGFAMYNIRLLNCRQAIRIEEFGILEYPWENHYFGYAGIRMTEAVLEANHGRDTVLADMNWPTILRFISTEFRGDGAAFIYTPSKAVSGRILPDAAFINCAFTNWDESSVASGFEPQYKNCVFNGPRPSDDRVIPPDEFTPPPPPKPARPVLYNAKDEKYGAAGNGESDDGNAIQAALNEAGADGGGIVYLPAGYYRVSRHLTVPAGVELRGVSPVRNRDQEGLSLGTVLFAYEGRGSPNPETDTAFITLNGDGAGVRGLRVFYPENNPKYELEAYPYTIRGHGTGVYIMGGGFVNSCYGIDMRTYRCDGYYIKETIGTFFDRGIVVGGGSENGWILDNLSNPTVCTRIGFGGSDWLPEREYIFPMVINPVTRRKMCYILLDGAVDARLLSNCVYGAMDDAGFWFTGGSTGTAVNCMADGGGMGRREDGGSDVKVYNWLSAVLDDPMR